MSELRGRSGLSQQELAERSGLSLRYTQDIEAGTKNVTIEALAAVATALSVEVADLFSASVLNAPRRRGRPRKTR